MAEPGREAENGNVPDASPVRIHVMPITNVDLRANDSTTVTSTPLSTDALANAGESGESPKQSVESRLSRPKSSKSKKSSKHHSHSHHTNSHSGATSTSAAAAHDGVEVQNLDGSGPDVIIPVLPGRNQPALLASHHAWRGSARESVGPTATSSITVGFTEIDLHAPDQEEEEEEGHHRARHGAGHSRIDVEDEEAKHAMNPPRPSSNSMATRSITKGKGGSGTHKKGKGAGSGKDSGRKSRESGSAANSSSNKGSSGSSSVIDQWNKRAAEAEKRMLNDQDVPNGAQGMAKSIEIETFDAIVAIARTSRIFLAVITVALVALGIAAEAVAAGAASTAFVFTGSKFIHNGLITVGVLCLVIAFLAVVTIIRIEKRLALITFLFSSLAFGLAFLVAIFGFAYDKQTLNTHALHAYDSMSPSEQASWRDPSNPVVIVLFERLRNDVKDQAIVAILCAAALALTAAGAFRLRRKIGTIITASERKLKEKLALFTRQERRRAEIEKFNEMQRLKHIEEGRVGEAPVMTVHADDDHTVEMEQRPFSSI